PTTRALVVNSLDPRQQTLLVEADEGGARCPRPQVRVRSPGALGQADAEPVQLVSGFGPTLQLEATHLVKERLASQRRPVRPPSRQLELDGPLYGQVADKEGGRPLRAA